MMSRIVPYTARETVQAAEWLGYVSDCSMGITGTAARTAVIQEAIDKLERRGLISCVVAMLLSEIFDVPRRA